MRQIIGVATALILGSSFATTGSGGVAGVGQSEVTWLRDGCKTLLEESDDPAGSSDTIDYWGPVCHGYAIAARDYITFLTGSIQAQLKLPVQGCYAEGESITGQQVAEVFVEYVDRHPASLGQPAASVMFDAVTQQWCPDLQSLGDAQ